MSDIETIAADRARRIEAAWMDADLVSRALSP